jgi:hypothetical protein
MQLQQHMLLLQHVLLPVYLVLNGTQQQSSSQRRTADGHCNRPGCYHFCCPAALSIVICVFLLSGFLLG